MSEKVQSPKKITYQAAVIIYTDYKLLIKTYLKITEGGKERFEKRAFNELFKDAQKRYGLYRGFIGDTLQKLTALLNKKVNRTTIWKEINKEYSMLMSHRKDRHVAETFFNSLTRKIFNTKGFNPEIEFFDFSDYSKVVHNEPKVYDTIKADFFSPAYIKQVLSYYNFSIPYINIEEDAKAIFERMVKAIVFQQESLQLEEIRFLKNAFYRNKGAFIVGYLKNKRWTMPFIIPLLNEERGIFVDTVIYDPNEVSVMFSFTRASFFAYTRKPVELIDFLKRIMPFKNVGELYDSIGYFKHGKTMLYRDLYKYIHNHDDEFIIAPGIKGMVMSVFTLRNYNFVFKIIKDTFDKPKNISRKQVIEKYRQVEYNDRVGRLAFAHLFEHLEFDRKLFSEELIDELKSVAKETVVFSENKVHIKHVYLERRMTPLNIYLKKASLVDQCRAVLDYGYAVKELAAANIFPGDLLQKNFGVTRHGRVIFYDYDEICKITECNFKRIPPPRDHFDEFSNEPHFAPNPDDVFPEEFKKFMAPKGPTEQLFMEEHGDLFDPKYWRTIKKRIEEGDMVEFYAYDERRRFKKSYTIKENQ